MATLENFFMSQQLWHCDKKKENFVYNCVCQVNEKTFFVLLRFLQDDKNSQFRNSGGEVNRELNAVYD